MEAPGRVELPTNGLGNKGFHPLLSWLIHFRVGTSPLNWGQAPQTAVIWQQIWQQVLGYLALISAFSPRAWGWSAPGGDLGDRGLRRDRAPPWRERGARNQSVQSHPQKRADYRRSRRKASAVSGVNKSDELMRGECDDPS
jgi:hypothetical protein